MTKEIIVPHFKPILLKQPVHAHWPISARVGYINPKLWKTRGYHTGTDFAIPVGEPVYASCGGTCQLAGNSHGAAGIRVWIESHDNRLGAFRHGYCHLSEVYPKVGDYVMRGQIVGLTGATGHVTGPHLHFQVELLPSREILSPEFF